MAPAPWQLLQLFQVTWLNGQTWKQTICHWRLQCGWELRYMKDSPHKFNLLVLDGILPVLPFRSICSEFSTSSSSRKLTTVFMISACLEQVKLEGECAGRAKSTGRDEGSFQPLNTRSHNVVFVVPKGTNQPLLQDLPPSPLHAFQSSLQGWPFPHRNNRILSF